MDGTQCSIPVTSGRSSFGGAHSTCLIMFCVVASKSIEIGGTNGKALAIAHLSS